MICEPCILLLGLVVAALRTSRGRGACCRCGSRGAVYVDLFRGCPLIILLLPVRARHSVAAARLAAELRTVWGGVAIVLFYAAYVAEVFRAGIQSVHPSQRAAARSLGLTQAQTLRLVVLPQAVRTCLPPLLNDFVALQKDVGLVSILGAASTRCAGGASINADARLQLHAVRVAALLFIAAGGPDAVGSPTATRCARHQPAAGRGVV